MISRNTLFFALSCLACTIDYQSANAYVPPAFHVYNRLAVKNDSLKSPPVALSMKVTQHSVSGTELPVGTFQIQIPREYQSGWPTLSLLTARSPEELNSIVKKFGLAIIPEASLLAPKPANAHKSPIRRFYLQDETMSMRRLRNTIAYVHSLPGDLQKSIWFEKESLSLLKISSPCPSSLLNIPGVKAGGTVCSLEFRNLIGFHLGRVGQSKFTLYRDDQPTLTFLIDRFINPKTPVTENATHSISTIDLPETHLSLVRELFN